MDVNSLQQIKPRSVGAEHVSLEVIKKLQIPQILEEAGLNTRQQAEALGEGNVSEGSTLEKMLKCLQAPVGALVIMDAGIASEENLQWLITNHYNYLVVSRERKRDIGMEQTSVIESAGGHQIHLHRQAGEHPGEIRPACWSEQRAMKGQNINESFRAKYEHELQKISHGLQKPGFTKKRDAIHQRIGRLKERCKRVSAHYQIDLKVDEASGQVTALTWNYQPEPASKQTHPGVYKLRTTQILWDDETLWRTYTMLTDLESVFRSLKSELGMRPVYHHLENRCDGHPSTMPWRRCPVTCSVTEEKVFVIMAKSCPRNRQHGNGIKFDALIVGCFLTLSLRNSPISKTAFEARRLHRIHLIPITNIHSQ